MNWSQFRTILWLRWRLSRNQLGRAGMWNALLTGVVIICGSMFAVGGCLAGIFAGYVGLASAPPETLLIVWDVGIALFLCFWMFGVVAEIQRSESIDVARLLHLPVSLRDVFCVNYVASHLTLSVVLVVPAMFGLAAGLSAGRGISMLLLFPLLIGFIFMISAWTYCLRGWLASLMINPRRRRAIVIGITMGFVLLGQLPNLYFNLVGHFGRSRNEQVRANPPDDLSAVAQANSQKQKLPAAFFTAHTYVPFLWVGKGAFDLGKGNIWPALVASVAAFGIGALGLSRAYRATLRFYLGQTAGKESIPKPEVRASPASGQSMMERGLPGIPEQAAALALASFRSMMRAPEVKMALATSLVMWAIFGMIIFSRSARMGSESGKPFLVTGAVLFVMFGMVQLMFNQFGVDRDGFRTLVLLPARRQEILLGKNLAFLPIVLGSGMIMLLALKFVIGVSVVAVVSGILQLVSAFLLVCIAGNLVSIVVPYRIAPGSLKATKTPIKTAVVVMLSHLLFPLAMTPTLIPPAIEWLNGYLGWFPSIPVNLLLSLLLAASGVVAYWLSLGGLGELFQRRELRMLQVLTHDLE